ncbi:MAG: hypothetical protein O3B01_17400 [Planctomycetota bacterium]|nr:hypothetical protein [Planctomycetota bacterium]
MKANACLWSSVLVGYMLLTGYGQTVLAAELVRAEVETRPASPLGNTALTANGRIQPHGLPTICWFEYGPSKSYGQQTSPQPLGPKLAAYYHESWDHGSGGWLGGMSGKDLVHHRKGGAPGGFMRFSEPSGDDPNHVDGIGTLHLTSFFYPGSHPSDVGLQGWWGGGDPDLRDAKVTISVRGNRFVPNGTEFVWWTQSDKDIAQQLTSNWRRANWAYTGFSLTDALLSGKWERVSYRLNNNSHDWTYGGHNLLQNRPNYVYDSINNSLAHLNCDFFHLLAFVNPEHRPTGSIDLDEFTVAYRNYSLIHPANGGKLIAAPEDGLDDPAKLTDGWRFGKDRSWRSVKAPASPQEFVYQFANPVTIKTVQVHQHAEWPSIEVEIATSEDGRPWTPLLTKTVPKNSPGEQNFAFLLEQNLSRKATSARVRITSGYHEEHWGLGEIEFFGDGGVHSTDDDWYHVNLDLQELKPGQNYHYQLVAENSAGKVAGPDMSFTVPVDGKPYVATGESKRIKSDAATVTGRLTPMGKKTQFFFEYGIDARYGSKSAEQYGGIQITPRLASAVLTGLKPGKTYHYRLVGVNEDGTTFGPDAMFTTLAK